MVLAAFLLSSCASFVEKDIRSYLPTKKGVKKVYALKRLRVVMESEPSRYDSNLVLKVERQKISYWYRKVTTKRFRIWDDDRPREPLKRKAKTKVETTLIPTPVWEPFAGQKMKIRVSCRTEPFEITTDDKGLATFDVGPFAHFWIEGRELTVHYLARLPDYKNVSDDLWETLRKKKTTMPVFVKALGKVEVSDREGQTILSPALLEKIFR